MHDNLSGINVMAMYKSGPVNDDANCLELTGHLLVGVPGDVRAPKAARGFVCEVRDSNVEPDISRLEIPTPWSPSSTEDTAVITRFGG